MKKIIALAIATTIITFTACGTTTIAASDTTDSTIKTTTVTEADDDNTILLWPKQITEETFLEYSENIEGSEKFDGYTIKRNLAGIAIAPENKGEQLIAGSNFVLASDKIWFINTERKIASFNFKEFSYFENCKNKPYDYLKSNQYEVFGSADLPETFERSINEWAHYYEYVEFNGPVAFVENNGTLIFTENSILFESKHKASNKFSFPFVFKEVGYLGHNTHTCENIYAFLSDTNTIGTITVKSDNTLDCNIIAEGSDYERSLFRPSSTNHVNCVTTNNGYVIYYENGILKGSNGQVHFDFDSLEYKKLFIGDTYGVGKGFEDCCFVASCSKMQSTDDINQMVIDSGINY